jgi:hypothetical protein
MDVLLSILQNNISESVPVREKNSVITYEQKRDVLEMLTVGEKLEITIILNLKMTIRDISLINGKLGITLGRKINHYLPTYLRR